CGGHRRPESLADRFPLSGRLLLFCPPGRRVSAQSAPSLPLRLGRITKWIRMDRPLPSEWAHIPCIVPAPVHIFRFRFLVAFLKASRLLLLRRSKRRYSGSRSCFLQQKSQHDGNTDSKEKRYEGRLVMA